MLAWCSARLEALGGAQPLLFPDDIDPAYQPEAVVRNFEEAYPCHGARSWLDCDEFPCVVAIHRPPSGEQKVECGDNLKPSRVNIILDPADMSPALVWGALLPDGALEKLDERDREAVERRLALRLRMIREDATAEALLSDTGAGEAE